MMIRVINQAADKELIRWQLTQCITSIIDDEKKKIFIDSSRLKPVDTIKLLSKIIDKTFTATDK